MLLPEGRKKPWGTGQAILACRNLVKEPFAVINADDYYGKQAFVKIHEYLVNEVRKDSFCMAGFILKNTLSIHGGVTRGICTIDSHGYLTDIVETHDIVMTDKGIFANGEDLDAHSCVSMNMWGMTPDFIDNLYVGFKDFFSN